MGRFLKSRMMAQMVPYFILAVAVIVTWHVVGSWRIFAEGLERFWGIITPFMWGVLVAYIINMPTSFFQRILNKTGKPFIIKRSRVFGFLISMILVLTLVGLALNFIIPTVYDNVVLFINEFENNQMRLLDFINRINSWDLPEFIGEIYIDTDEIMASVMSWLTNFVEEFDSENVATIVNVVGNVFGSIFSTMFHGILAFVSSIFLVIHRDRFLTFARRLLTAAIAEKPYAYIMKYAGKLNSNFRMYIYTQTIDGLILGTIMTIVLAIAGSPYFLVLGLMLGVINYIPYFGSIIGTAIALVVVAFTQGIGLAFILLPIMFAIQQLDGNFIQPKLMGGSFSLSPLLIIISVTIGGAYAGILGMLMAIPIVAMLKDILDNVITHLEAKKEKKKLAKNETEPLHPPDFYNPYE
jgi:predicted PurR-regulated permease PerM